MFSSKKNNLPPRPQLPNYEYILEDLRNAAVDDVAFKIINDLSIKESYGVTSTNNSDDIYKKVKIYLNTKQQLRQLECILKREEQQLKTDNEEIRKLADDIKREAETALITYM